MDEAQIKYSATMSLGRLLEHIDNTASGALALTDEQGLLIGITTDGDIRRALLKGAKLKDSANKAINRNPLTSTPELDAADRRQLMRAHNVRHLPIISESGSLVSFETIDSATQSTPVILMVGGLGSRLMPLTETCPKPLLPLGGRPILEHIIRQYKGAGFTNFVLCLNYLGDMIADYFADGSKWGVNISYLRETRRLGTAGALSLLPADLDSEHIIVSNGDVLSNMDYRAFFNFHSSQKASLTVGAREYRHKVRFGVIETTGANVTAIVEKPEYVHHINGGIYALNTQLLSLVPDDTFFDMPDLVNKAVKDGGRCGVYPIHEEWHDIGTPEDYHSMNDRFTHND